MIKEQQFKPGSTDSDFHLTDQDILTLITSIINANPGYKNIQKGVWAWNRNDHSFLCSASFQRLMAIPPLSRPNLDFWVDRLSSGDLVKFVDTLENVLIGKKSHSIFFNMLIPELGQRIIQCTMESMTSPVGKNYIVCVCCDISERIFSDKQN